MLLLLSTDKAADRETMTCESCHEDVDHDDDDDVSGRGVATFHRLGRP